MERFLGAEAPRAPHRDGCHGGEKRHLRYLIVEPYHYRSRHTALDASEQPPVSGSAVIVSARLPLALWLTGGGA